MCLFKFLFKSINKEEKNNTETGNQEEMDDLEFDEMNDVWDEMDDL